MCWEVRLEPYDLVAVQLSEPNVQFSNPQATWPGSVETALGSQIRRLGARAAALRNPPPLDVVANPGFERPPAGDGPIPDWAVTTQSGVSIQLDKTQKHGGQQSVKIASTGAVACLVSRPFPAAHHRPALDGRLAPRGRCPAAAAAAIGHRRKAPRPRLLSFRPGRSGARSRPALGRPSRREWGQFVFQVDDLPLEGLTSLRVRFDLMGAGEVWVDDVQLFGLAFSRSELVELSKLITLADVKLQNGQMGDCLRLLEGYWPRFLEENVPLPAGAATSDTVTAQPHPAEEKPPERSGFLNRVKDMLPESLRF